MKFYMRLVNRLFFSRIEVVGFENIPNGKPIIFSANHQNAFLDALLVGVSSPVRITSMTRSDVFHTPFRWFLEALQMMPIYRLRDGIDKLELNEKVFENIRELLRDNKAILIFSEGNHGNEFYLRPLSKGSSRMALESLDRMPDKDIQIVPIGLNYTHHQRPFHQLTVVFGEPIAVKDYYEGYQAHEVRGTNQLKLALTDGMRNCLWYPDENEEYLQRKQLINWQNEGVSFHDLRQGLAESEELKFAEQQNRVLYTLGKSLGLINFLPLFLLQKVLTPIRDKVFYQSIKYAFALIVFPIWWLLIFIAVGLYYSWSIGLIVIAIQLFALILRQWLIKRSSIPH